MSKPINSLQSLIDWLETKPADEAYDAKNLSGCLLGQYFGERGFPRELGASSHDRYGPFKASNDMQQVAFYGEWTFGAALSRARALVSA